MASISADGLGLAALKAGRARARRTGATRVPVASVTLSASATSSAALPNSPPSATAWAEHVGADREHGQRARFAGELDRRASATATQVS